MADLIMSNEDFDRFVDECERPREISDKIKEAAKDLDENGLCLAERNLASESNLDFLPRWKRLQ